MSRTNDTPGAGCYKGTLSRNVLNIDPRYLSKKDLVYESRCGSFPEYM